MLFRSLEVWNSDGTERQWWRYSNMTEGAALSYKTGGAPPHPDVCVVLFFTCACRRQLPPPPLLTSVPQPPPVRAALLVELTCAAMDLVGVGGLFCNVGLPKVLLVTWTLAGAAPVPHAGVI